MERFFKKGLTISKLLEICQKSVAEGYGDAVVEVQADTDGISDIMINDIEGLGDENNSKVLSLVSAIDKQQFERIYGKID